MWAWASTQTESEVSNRCGVPVQTVLGGWPRTADRSSVDDVFLRETRFIIRKFLKGKEIGAKQWPKIAFLLGTRLA